MSLNKTRDKEKTTAVGAVNVGSLITLTQPGATIYIKQYVKVFGSCFYLWPEGIK